MTRRVSFPAALALVLALPLAGPLCAETPAEGFAKAAGARTAITKLEFHDDPTDVTGKAWEFTKALVGASGVEDLNIAGLRKIRHTYGRRGHDFCLWPI